jgi:hypothetical protein
VTVEQAAARFGKFSREYDGADPVEKSRTDAARG